MRIAVLGARGFLGQRLLHSLSRAGHEVIAVSRGPEPADLPAGTRYVQSDYRRQRRARARAGHIRLRDRPGLGHNTRHLAAPTRIGSKRQRATARAPDRDAATLRAVPVRVHINWRGSSLRLRHIAG
ncbi:MAG: NAD-dependent epimerase/dehydratase family protein [Gammaproteobacteria bacterium]|nr:NAD-dependent epimerase/dehydratase family protein [Gammaproteobacteria bacterium]